jgi:hypothetical protein
MFTTYNYKVKKKKRNFSQKKKGGNYIFKPYSLQSNKLNPEILKSKKLNLEVSKVTN